MLIDCTTCVARDTAACDDCIVTALLDRPPGAVVFDAAEERALRVLADAGLAPDSRYSPVGPRPSRASRPGARWSPTGPPEAPRRSA